MSMETIRFGFLYWPPEVEAGRQEAASASQKTVKVPLSLGTSNRCRPAAWEVRQEVTINISPLLDA